MKNPLRILAAEAVIPGVLKIRWSDSYDAIRDPDYFRSVQVESHGHSVFWGVEGDEDVDFGCDRLREMAEEQAALLARAS